MPLPAPSTSLGLRTSEELALSPPDGLQSTFYTRCPRRDPRALGVSFQPQVRISSSVFPLERGQGWGRRGPPGGGTHPAGNPPPPPRQRPTPGGSRRPGADLPAPHPGASGLPGVGPPRCRRHRRRRRRDLPSPSPPAADSAPGPPGYPAACQSGPLPAGLCGPGLRPGPGSGSDPALGGSRGRGVARGHVPGPAPPAADAELARAPGPAGSRPPARDGAAARVGEEPVPILPRPARRSDAPAPFQAPARPAQLSAAPSQGHPCSKTHNGSRLSAP